MSFHVMTCRKYSRQTIRVVECDDVDAVLDGPMGECALCGPCSHVEVGSRKDYWKVISSHETEQDAVQAAWEETDRDGDRYDTSYLPKREELQVGGE